MTSLQIGDHVLCRRYSDPASYGKIVHRSSFHEHWTVEFLPNSTTGFRSFLDIPISDLHPCSTEEWTVAQVMFS